MMDTGFDTARTVIKVARATGLPVIEGNSQGLAAGYTVMPALPIHRGHERSVVVAWYL